MADSALYSQDNLQSMTSLNWLTRIPLTLPETQQKLEQASNFQASELEDYRIAQARSDCARLYRKQVKRFRIS